MWTAAVCTAASVYVAYHRYKPFIDIRLRPGITKAAPASHAAPYGPLRPNVASPIKPEVHNAAQHRWMRTEPRPQGNCTKNFVTIGPVVPEICLQRDRQTDTQTDRNTPLPYWGGIINNKNRQL